MERQLFYLSCPYNDENKNISKLRFDQANKVAAALIVSGQLVISPLTHNVTLLSYGLPTGWEFWGELDSILIDRCDRLLVLMLEGWDTSGGVAKEIALAKKLGKPVDYLNPENY